MQLVPRLETTNCVHRFAQSHLLLKDEIVVEVEARCHKCSCLHVRKFSFVVGYLPFAHSSNALNTTLSVLITQLRCVMSTLPNVDALTRVRCVKSSQQDQRYPTSQELRQT